MRFSLQIFALISLGLCSLAIGGEKYDYIVVGSGPGGVPVARRLAEAGKKVLVLERGSNVSGHPDIYLRPPRYFDSTIMAEWWVKKYAHERDDRLNQNQPYVTQWGAALGGSTTINGQIAMRGDRKSYDDWVTEFGLKDWGYFGLLPYLVKIENNSRYNASDNTHYLNNQGPVPIISEIESGTYNNLYLQSLASSPVHSVGPNPYISTNSDIRGAAFVDKTFGPSRGRALASENYLDPVVNSLPLTVITNAIVTQLLTSASGSKVVGVTVLIEGETEEFKIRGDGEVILAAGPFETPKILMLSGFGPLDQLNGNGIPVKKVVDGIGRNFHDHPGFIYINLGNVTEPKNLLSYPPPQSVVDQWKNTATGPIALSSDPITAFYSSGVNGAEVDVQISFGDGIPVFALPYPNSYFIQCYNMKPKSRGRITLRNTNPISDPVIDMGYYTNDTDIKVIIECLKFAHQLSTDTVNSPIARFTTSNLSPGLPESLWSLPASVLDPILTQVIFAAGSQGYHFAGSTAMGSVLNDKLAIPGVSGLRVVGVSAQPKVVGFNPQLATYAMSEKLADLIKRDSIYDGHSYHNNLSITSLCNGRWRVSNPNNLEAVFDWKAKDAVSNQPLYQGTFSVAANSNSIIFTDKEPIRVRVSVYLNGNLQATADNNSC